MNTSIENLLPEQKSFFEKAHGLNHFFLLLQKKSGVYFFVKDKGCSIIYANELTLERCGCKSQSEIFNKTDFDFFPPNLAEKYRNNDRDVMKTGIPLTNMPELAPNSGGIIHCYITNKIPLYDLDNNCIGIAGATTSYDYSYENVKPYIKIAKSIQFIKENFHQNLSIPDMAKEAAMHPRKFSDTFNEVFNLTPQSYIIHVRVHAAAKALTDGTETIAQIAKTVGFYDHSVFTKQFTKLMGISPTNYRKKHIIQPNLVHAFEKT